MCFGDSYIEEDSTYQRVSKVNLMEDIDEYYGVAEPPVRCGESHLSGLTEPPVDSYSA